MLPTFVIGLREGLEAALIVGIIAAFVTRQGRRELLRWVSAGVAAAVLLCLAVGIALQAVSAELPQREQEGLETVVGVAAVGMVTYMVVWMRRHSRELKGQLEGAAAEAMASTDQAGGGFRAGRAMVLMAFLAVLREGFETVVFLLAAFHESGNAGQSVGGALAGIAVAILLGYGVYRGGVKLNLSKFFRATGIVLVLVAAGLVATALHTAHEAGWLNVGQGSTADLSALVRPGTVRSALLTGMLGVQGHPVVIEVVGWLVYLVPIGLYVGWPPHRKPARRTLVRVAAGVAGAGAVLLAVSLATLPDQPRADPVTGSAAPTAQLVGAAADSVSLRLDLGSGVATVVAHRTGTEKHGGVSTSLYTATQIGPVAAGQSGQSGQSGQPGQAALPAEVTYDQAAALNGGRLPLGVRPSAQSGVAASGTVHVAYAVSKAVTAWVEPRTGRVVDLRWTTTTTATLTGTPVGDVVLDRPVATASDGIASFEAEAASDAARHDLSALDRRGSQTAGAWIGGVAAVLAGVYVLCLVLVGRRPSSGGSVTRITPGRAVAPSE